MERVIYGKRGGLTVTLTDTEALQALHAVKSKFAQELCAKAAHLTGEQMWWVHKLVKDAAAPKPAAVAVGDMAGVVALFKKAGASLKRPVIRLTIGAGDAAVSVRITVAGAGALVPGSLNVVSDDAYENRVWYGRVKLCGAFEPSRKLTGADAAALPLIATLLKRFAADPAAVAAEYGTLTGACCFCSKLLTDEGSIEVGYGPTCAKNWGLPHQPKGAKPAAVFTLQA